MTFYDYKIVRVITFPLRRLYNYTDSLNTLLQAPLAIKDKVTTLSDVSARMFGTVTATGMFGRGAADAAISYACQDGVCFAISCVGMGFDTLGIMANFVPGPNVTQIVTVAGSLGCKVFVASCRNNKLPWHNIC